MGLLPFRHRRNGVFTLTDTLALLQSLSFEKSTNVNYSHIETHLKEEVGGGRDWARFFRLDGRRRRSFTLGRLHRVKIGKQTNCWSILLFLFPSDKFGANQLVYVFTWPLLINRVDSSLITSPVSSTCCF